MSGEISNRRLALLRVSPESLVALLKGDTLRVITNALPADAEVVGIGEDSNRWMYEAAFHEIHIVIRSADFAEVEPGGMIPLLPQPVFLKIEK